MASIALNAVRKMYPSAPNPSAYARSNWLKEENIHMSYSFIAAGGTEEDCLGF